MARPGEWGLCLTFEGLLYKKTSTWAREFACSTLQLQRQLDADGAIPRMGRYVAHGIWREGRYYSEPDVSRAYAALTHGPPRVNRGECYVLNGSFYRSLTSWSRYLSVPFPLLRRRLSQVTVPVQFVLCYPGAGVPRPFYDQYSIRALLPDLDAEHGIRVETDGTCYIDGHTYATETSIARIILPERGQNASLLRALHAARRNRRIVSHTNGDIVIVLRLSLVRDQFESYVHAHEYQQK